MWPYDTDVRTSDSSLCTTSRALQITLIDWLIDCSVVCVCVCIHVNCANDWTEILLDGADWYGLKNHVLDRVPDPPWKAALLERDNSTPAFFTPANSASRQDMWQWCGTLPNYPEYLLLLLISIQKQFLQLSYLFRQQTFNVYKFCTTNLAYLRKSMRRGKHKGSITMTAETVMVKYRLMYHLSQNVGP